MTSRSQFLRGPFGAVALTLYGSTALGQAPTTAPEPSPVLASLEEQTALQRSFLPKYSPEWFLDIGYAGTPLFTRRQWPATVLGGEVLFARPGRFDFGAILQARLGRPEANYGPFEAVGGFELMLRFAEKGGYLDFAAVGRITYALDAAHPDNVLLRVSPGLDVSLLRSVVLELAYEPLYSKDRTFGDSGDHWAHGFAINIKAGLCLFATCRQIKFRERPTIDRSAVACNDAAAVCAVAEKSGGRGELCSAAQRALDPSRYPAAGDDPVAAYLVGLAKETRSEPALREKLQTLATDHKASWSAIDAYAERVRKLDDGEVLSAGYSYLVTPSMIRDWLGCDFQGRPTACVTAQICENDTGVRAP
jgi:hypothetical protein